MKKRQGVKQKLQPERDPQKNFRLSLDGRRILSEQSEALGITETAVLEIALRRFEDQEKVLRSTFPGDRGNLYLDYLAAASTRGPSSERKDQK